MATFSDSETLRLPHGGDRVMSRLREKETVHTQEGLIHIFVSSNLNMYF